MIEEVRFNQCAVVLAALASAERLQIVRQLRAGPRTVGEIAENLDIPMCNLSHHLAVLRRAGLLCNRKKGRFVHYSLAPGLLQTAQGIEHLNLGCCRLEMPEPEEASAPPARD